MYKYKTNMRKYTIIEIDVDITDLKTCPSTGEVLYSEIKKQITNDIMTNNFSFTFAKKHEVA